MCLDDARFIGRMANRVALFVLFLRLFKFTDQRSWDTAIHRSLPKSSRRPLQAINPYRPIHLTHNFPLLDIVEKMRLRQFSCRKKLYKTNNKYFYHVRCQGQTFECFEEFFVFIFEFGGFLFCAHRKLSIT